MDRILTYTVSSEESDLRADQFLSRRGFSSHLMTRLRKDMEHLLINGVPSRTNTPLHEGDVLTVHIVEEHSSYHVPPVELPLSIVYEDEDILVANKPAGMPIHPSMDNYYNSLANALAWYYRDSGNFIFRCTNRLDRDTSGLTVIAKNMLSSAILSDMAVRHAITREYLAIVRGVVTPPSGTITVPLSRKPGSIIERCVDFEHGERTVTHYKTVKTQNGHSLVSLQLETGRTHQIRIHMKYLGFPLVGDYLYNRHGEIADAVNKKLMEDEDMVRWSTINDVPEGFYRDTVKQLMADGIIKGKGDGVIDITEDMLRTMIFCQRIMEAKQ